MGGVNQHQAAGTESDHAPEGWSGVNMHAGKDNGNRNDIQRTQSTNGYQCSTGSSKVFLMQPDWPLQMQLPQCA